METVLNVQVSWFANYRAPVPEGSRNIEALLREERHREMIERIRSTCNKDERDRLKSTLPAFTPSALCSRRSKKAVIQHSGLIQFDIDAKENPSHPNWENLKKLICESANIAYCALSISGNGLWGLIPIAYPERHKQYLEHIQRYFGNRGIFIDKAPSSTVSLRGISYDPDAYYNIRAEYGRTVIPGCFFNGQFRTL